MAEEFVVKDFKLDVADLSARRFEKKDINRDVCAIIKILSDISGLKFDGNNSITDQQYKEGIYWVYVSPSERQLKIIKEGFKTLIYNIPLRIESSNVYLMDLGRQSSVNTENTNTSGLILLKTEPEKADVRINGEFKGKTPFQLELSEGKYNYKLSKSLFHSFEGTFEIKANETTKPELVKLRKNYGSLNIKTLPEEGVEIEIDQKPINAKTPFIIDLLPSGEHALGLNKDMYEPVNMPFAIEDDVQTPLTITMIPIFGTININTKPLAEIYIDGNLKSRGAFNGRLIKGMHTIEIKLDKHYTQTIKQDIQINKTENLTIDLKPKLGLLMVMCTNPEEAKLYIDDKPYGNTPLVVKDLPIGSHILKLEKEGFQTLTKNIEIKENEKISEQLELKIYNKQNYNTITLPAGSVLCPSGATVLVSVINPRTGKTWMDRNLGASQAAKSSMDANSYGDLYQWGRTSDGHQCRSSATTTTLSTVDQTANGNFIMATNATSDWRSPQNTNLWQGVNGVNNPCPKAYRLPTEAELEAEISSWSSNDAAGAFASPLKLPLAGFRFYSDGSLSTGGVLGGYWSSSVSGIISRYLSFNTGHAYVGNFHRALGLSVRCLKN